MNYPRWTPGSLADDISKIVHAFDDEHRRDMVRALADRVADLERALATSEDHAQSLADEVSELRLALAALRRA